MQTARTRRSGAVLLDAAIVYPALIVFLLGIVVGGIGVFRYLQVAAISRETARWVAVRGAEFERSTGQTSPGQQQVFDQIALVQTAGIPAELLTLQIQWLDQGTGVAHAWDAAAREVLSINANGEYVTNSVRVTLSYQWAPNVLGMNALTISSSCEIPMAN